MATLNLDIDDDGKNNKKIDSYELLYDDPSELFSNFFRWCIVDLNAKLVAKLF